MLGADIAVPQLQRLESQLVDGKCPDCGREVKPAKEAYFLRLSKYQKKLEEFIENNENFIYPEARKRKCLITLLSPACRTFA